MSTSGNDRFRNSPRAGQAQNGAAPLSAPQEGGAFRRIAVDDGHTYPAPDLDILATAASGSQHVEHGMEDEANTGFNDVRFVADPRSPSSPLPDIGELEINVEDGIDEEMGDTTMVSGHCNGQEQRGDGGDGPWEYSCSRDDLVVKATQYLQRQHPMLDVNVSVLASDGTCASALAFRKCQEETRAHVVRYEVYEGSTFYCPRKFLHRYARKEDAIRRFGRELSASEMHIEQEEGKVVLQSEPLIRALQGEQVKYEKKEEA